MTLAAAAVSAHPYQISERADKYANWAPAGPNDVRSPCPMMNTLANHGFFPHDGRNLTEENLVNGLSNGLNFAPEFGKLMFSHAIQVNTEPNATAFTLGMLNTHNVLEHDASLSRLDAYFGNNHLFNETVFETVTRYWGEDVVTPTQLAMSKMFRQIESKSFNPTYKFDAPTEGFSLGEVSAPIVAFGDLETMTVNRSFVDYFFRNERLPTEIGWTQRDFVMTNEKIDEIAGLVDVAQTLITSDNSTSTKRRRQAMVDLHAGYFGSH